MSDFSMFSPSLSGIGSVLWQSGLFLIMGLAASHAMRRRPARAHRILLLAILGALAAPPCSQLARRQGWGLWTTTPSDAPRSPMPAIITTSAPDTLSPEIISAVAARPAGPMLPAPGRSGTVAGPPIEKRVGSPDRSSVPAAVPLPLPDLVLGGWLIVSALCLARLIASLFVGLSTVRRARPLEDEALAGAAALAAARLGVGRLPELRTSPQVRCPAIWCWGRRPIILMPETTAGAASIEPLWHGLPGRGEPRAGCPCHWGGVFCHELAHWVRRDHLADLAAEVLTALLPWQPLAWWAKHRLGQLSELACDDWVLSTGLEATDYAESLLGLVPQRRAALALTAVSSRRGLIGRVRHILEERRISPVVGTRWAILSAAAMVLAAAALALAQTRPAETKNATPKQETAPVSADKPATSAKQETAKRRMIRGTVLGPDGRPIAGATVLLVGYTKPTVPFVAMPRDRQDQRNDPRDVVLARAVTETDGRYTLTAEVIPDDWNSLLVVARAPGFGVHAHYLKKYGGSVNVSQLDATERTLRLAPEVVIHGRLLTPSGMPASGVRVTLDGFYNDERMGGMHVGLTPTDAEIPPYWPRPRKTDADGRFTLEGLPRGTYATLTFWHPDYAVDEVTVNLNGTDSLTPGLRAFEIKPVKPSFTHTLEPARPVQGRVTDKATGKPLAGMLIEMIPMRSHGGMAFHTRTDAEGRYRVSGHQADSYITTVYPPADSGYLPPHDWQRGWPAGAKFLEKNFALEKGRIVRGRVIDIGTKLHPPYPPIAGAAVVYQPKRGNPNNRHEYDLRNTVLTDQEGRFAITTLPGQGFLAVETPDETYMRVPFTEGYRTAVFPQGLTAIDVPKEGEPKPVEITVRRGFPLEAQAVDPDGKPLAEVVAFYEGIDATLIDTWNQGRPFANGRFHIPNADLEKTYRVYFIEPERGLGAVVDLKAEPQPRGPIEVKLQPTAKVRGKLVTKSGSPVQGGQVNPMLVIREKEGEMSRDEVFRNTEFYSNIVGQKAMLTYQERRKIGPQGEFVIDTLVPGARFYIMAGVGNLEAWVSVPPLKPGEDRDLGTITLKERQP